MAHGGSVTRKETPTEQFDFLLLPNLFFFWFFFQNFVTNFPHTQVNKSFCDYLMQNNNKNRFFQKKKFKEQNNSILKPVPTCKKKNVTSRFYLSILWSELLGGGGMCH